MLLKVKRYFLLRMKSQTLDKIKQILNEFALNVSAHGVSNLKRAKSKINFCFWLIFYLASTSSSGYFLISTLNDYFQYEVVTIERFYREKTSDFPSIGICHTSPLVSNDSIDFLIEFITNETNSSFQAKNLTKLEYVNQYLRSVPAPTKNKINEILKSMDSEKRSKYGFSTEEMIIKCKFRTDNCTNSSHFTIDYHDTYGKCIIFNSNGIEINTGSKLTKL